MMMTWYTNLITRTWSMLGVCRFTFFSGSGFPVCNVKKPDFRFRFFRFFLWMTILKYFQLFIAESHATTAAYQKLHSGDEAEARTALSCCDDSDKWQVVKLTTG